MTRTDDTLLDEASRVLPELRSSFSRIISSLPSPVRRPRDLILSLGVRQTLAWKIMQVVHSRDAFAAAQHLPGTEGMNIFLEAAARKNVPTDAIDRARAAIADFQRLIVDHAGDRASLELMLGAATKDSVSPNELAYRKGSFQCASFVWGVQARARLMSIILCPDEDPQRLRLAKVAGYVGLRRVRPEIQWTLWHASCGAFQDSKVRRTLPFRPIDPEGVLPTGVPLLQEFCAAPPEQIQRFAVSEDEFEDRWVGGPVGDKAAITCFTGEVIRSAAPRYRDPENLYHEFGLQVRTPVEVLVQDLFVHRDLYGKVDPSLTVYSELGGRPWYSLPQSLRRDNNTLSFPERIEHLGQGSSVIHSTDIPRYDEMMPAAFRRLGWDIERCDVFRVRMAYPVIATAVVTGFDIPPAPQ